MEATGVCDWGEEFNSVDFGDTRLQNRFIHIAHRLLEQPMASINQAHEDWAATKAAYRLFKNERVTPDKILASHQRCTVNRARSQALVLAIQDTTLLNYNTHESTEGLGSIMHCASKSPKGLVMHSTIAFTPEGLPLGVIHQDIWARDCRRSIRKDAELRRISQQLPPEEKESGKWFRGLRATVSLLSRAMRVVTVADRECDIYDLVVEALQREAELVVRVRRDKRLSGDERKLWAYMLQQEVRFQMEVVVPRGRSKGRQGCQFVLQR
jgi:hypothetical protein